MFTILFWKAAAERALKTAGQNGVIALGAVAWTDIDQVISAGAAVGLAMLFGAALSLLTSLASANIGNAGPSLATEILIGHKDDVVVDFDPESTELDEPGGYISDLME